MHKQPITTWKSYEYQDYLSSKLFDFKCFPDKNEFFFHVLSLNIDF